MRIVDHSHMELAVTRVNIHTSRPDGTVRAQTAVLQEEHVLEARVNGRRVFRATCSPDTLGEMVAGRLVSDGMVASADAIKSIVVPADARVIEVTLNDGATLADRPQALISTCDSASAAYAYCFEGTYEPEPVRPIEWRVGDVRSVVAAFSCDAPMHKKSSGVHSAYLARGGEVLYCCEDLGRHNALDKVIGCALRDGVDLGTCSVMTSGRVPVDMMSKVIQARIPVFISKSIPTKAGVELAKTYGVTLICRAWPDSFDIYNDAWGGSGGSGGLGGSGGSGGVGGVGGPDGTNPQVAQGV